MKRLSEMTEDELEEEACRALDEIERMFY